MRTKITIGCDAQPLACDRTGALLSDDTDHTPDACMNFFTHDQVARMRFVLQNSESRISLRNSPGLAAPKVQANSVFPSGLKI